ncbi:unnamed protein product, partial [Mesorhabditis belari]|uniref:NR LBD domain-containing protein n=1 Tax=Mesorhabditis belari TaxID=2138241 RepID=A0AAF3EC78_9BILA
MKEEELSDDCNEILDLTDDLQRGEKCQICGGMHARRAYGGMACGWANFTARRAGCELRKRRGLIQSKEIHLKREFQMAAQNFARPLLYERLEAVDVVRSLMNIQNMITQDLHGRLVFDFPYSFELSLNQVLHNPTAVCSRIPLGYDEPTEPNIPLEQLPAMAARIVARALVHCTDLYRAIPEFWHLNEEDRINLISTQFAMQGMLNDYYHTYKYNFKNGLLSALGFRTIGPDCPVNAVPGIDVFFEDTYNWYVPYGVKLVIPAIRRGEMLDEEFLLIKTILLFSSAVGFSDVSAQVIRNAFNKYTSILLEHLKNRFQSPSMAIERFTALMSVPNYLLNASPKINAELGRNTLMKYCKLEGPLLEEIFHRQ